MELLELARECPFPFSCDGWKIRDRECPWFRGIGDVCQHRDNRVCWLLRDTEHDLSEMIADARRHNARR